MPWWGWITVGALLLVAELTIVDFGFYLVFLGASAFLVGLIDVLGFEMPYWAQWIVFALFAMASLVFFRQRAHRWLRPPPDAVVREGVEGGRASAIDSIPVGGTGRVRLRGADWTGRNVGAETIPAGASCLVERSDGLVLELRLDPGT